eukprot:401755-Hanusia_phi.AAC.1
MPGMTWCSDVWVGGVAIEAILREDRGDRDLSKHEVDLDKRSNVEDWSALLYKKVTVSETCCSYLLPSRFCLPLLSSSSSLSSILSTSTTSILFSSPFHPLSFFSSPRHRLTPSLLLFPSSLPPFLPSSLPPFLPLLLIYHGRSASSRTHLLNLQVTGTFDHNLAMFVGPRSAPTGGLTQGGSGLMSAP